MTAIKEKAPTLWDIGVELDDIHTQLEQIVDTLCIFNEQVDGDLGFLKQHDSCGQWFAERYEMARSLMSIAQLHMINTLAEMSTQIDAIYDANKKARSQAAE